MNSFEFEQTLSTSGVLAKGHVPPWEWYFRGAKPRNLYFTILLEVWSGTRLRSDGAPFSLTMKVPPSKYPTSKLLLSISLHFGQETHATTVVLKTICTTFFKSPKPRNTPSQKKFSPANNKENQFPCTCFKEEKPGGSGWGRQTRGMCISHPITCNRIWIYISVNL